MHKTIALIVSIWAAPAALHAQFDFRIDGRPVQVHGFAAQGFAYSNNNNYLTMDTSKGSFAMTDGGVNISAPVTDKFRVGAQAYLRNIGQLGNGQLAIDWAFADYKFKSWFGIRAGKVKTALGLFNDTQDMEFLHTWAILPQSLYPLDLRAATIAHTGGDAYGEILLRKVGSLNYTAYYGLRENDPRGGFYYSAADTGDKVLSLSGKTVGADLRWNTPIQGMMVGGSWADQTERLKASIAQYGNALLTGSNPQRITSAYGDYARGRWHFNGEYRRTHDVLEAVVLGTIVLSNQSETGWFLTAAYRVTKRLELGMYHSRYYVDAPHVASPAADHIFDHTVTARFDITRWWNVKIEGHFIDGYGDAYSAHGFYTRSNPNGLNPTTNMLVIRTGFYM